MKARCIVMGCEAPVADPDPLLMAGWLCRVHFVETLAKLAKPGVCSLCQRKCKTVRHDATFTRNLHTQIDGHAVIYLCPQHDLYLRNHPMAMRIAGDA